MNECELSVVIPVFNQYKVLWELYKRVVSTLSGLGVSYEIVFVDDGCLPLTQAILLDIVAKNEDVMCIELRHNYGQSNALAAGLQFAEGHYVVVMDADLQDKPEDISLLYKEILTSRAEMVLATRPSSNYPLWRRFASVMFFRLSSLLTTLKQPPNTGVFRIISRELLLDIISQPPKPGTILSRLQEKAIRVSTVHTTRDNVNNTKSSYTFTKLLRLGIERFMVYPRFTLPWFRSERFLKRYVPRYHIHKFHQVINDGD